MYLAETIAEFALGLQFEDIPPEDLAAAVTAVADTLACAVGAFDEPGPRILREYARDRGSHPQATLLGSTDKVDVALAALVNCTMARDLDANDLYAGPPSRDTGHFSDAIPALLAVAERTSASGRDFLTSVVIAYEVQAVLAEAYLWMQRGLHAVSQVT
ncbi:MAG: MmgE/PrpD family protein, partial [Hyphomicrobiales bacterium]|nr:MmgE/PrpD family protein [Hyphomicrobiales bacterium]